MTAAFRAPADRPSWTRVFFRGVVVTLTTALALWILAALIDGFYHRSPVERDPGRVRGR